MITKLTIKCFLVTLFLGLVIGVYAQRKAKPPPTIDGNLTDLTLVGTTSEWISPDCYIYRPKEDITTYELAKLTGVMAQHGPNGIHHPCGIISDGTGPILQLFDHDIEYLGSAKRHLFNTGRKN